MSVPGKPGKPESPESPGIAWSQLPGKPQADEDAVTRYAVTAALKDLGYLKAGTGRNISTTFPQKSGKDT